MEFREVSEECELGVAVEDFNAPWAEDGTCPPTRESGGLELFKDPRTMSDENKGKGHDNAKELKIEK